jgi:hypothetical protein
MLPLVVFHVLMLLLGLIVVSRVVSPQRVGNTLAYVHKSIGITTPAPDQVRTVAVIWIASMIVIVDGCIFLLLFITRLTRAG